MPKESLPAPVQLPDLSPSDLAVIAREIVLDVRELPDILKRFKLSKAQYQRLSENPHFKNALTSIAIDWNSATNTETRIKLNAAAILEVALPVLGGKVVAEKEPLREQVEGMKLLTRIAGIGADSAQGGGGEKFVINIDLGDDKQLRFEKNGKEVSTLPPIVIDQK